MKYTILNNKIPVALGFFALVFSVIIWSGFNQKIRTVLTCEIENTIYMRANFSEFNTGIDFDGNLYSETDYWDEPASNHYFVKMNGYELVDSNISHNKVNRIYYPVELFDYDKSISRQPNFDNFSVVKNSEITTYFTNGESASIDLNKYKSCNENINKPIFVKYWYNMAYGI